MHPFVSLLAFLGFAFCGNATADSDAVTTYAPVPPSAAGPKIPDSGYRVQSFGNGAYMVTEGLYQSLFFVACEGVIVVDAPPTIGHNILNAISDVTSLPVSHVVYSHSHADHIAAAYLLGSNVTTIAHRLTYEQLALAPDPKHRPFPTTLFDTSYRLQVCNQTVDLIYDGPNHEPGNIFIYAPLQKILMLVDVVFPGWVPFYSLALVENVPGYIKAHDQILNYDFDHFLGGHLNVVGTRQDVLIQQEYINDLYNNCVDALLLSAAPANSSSGLSAATLLPPTQEANPGNDWAVFDVYLGTLAEYCANVTTKKWTGRLGGADVFTPSNAQAMLNSARTDFGVLGPFGVLPETN